ncbi:MAG: hypothetical protein KDB02_06910 [Acidimicrobiales bacterium]|nr:hypothetical protein [Acidimicrobiales bacterium]
MNIAAIEGAFVLDRSSRTTEALDAVAETLTVLASGFLPAQGPRRTHQRTHPRSAIRLRGDHDGEVVIQVVRAAGAVTIVELAAGSELQAPLLSLVSNLSTVAPA